MELAEVVGSALRSRREERGMSLGALARAAGVGKGTLSEIERGVRNPTLSTVYALAAALGVPLATLLAGRPGVEVSSPGVTARLLEAVEQDDGTTVEVYLLRLEPGAEHVSPAHGTGVVEHLLVTAGRAVAGRVGEERELGPGESAQWVSDTTHYYRTTGDTTVQSVLVITSAPGVSSGHRA